MRTKLTHAAIAVVLPVVLLAVPGAQAQPADGFKIGYVDVDYVLSQMPEAKSIEEQLKAHEKQLSAELLRKTNEFQALAGDFQNNGANMTPDVRASRQQQLQELQINIQEFQQRAEMTMQKKRLELLEPVYAKIQSAIDQVAKEHDHEYVLAPNAGGLPIVLYSKHPDRDDLSDLVLNKLGITPGPTPD